MCFGSREDTEAKRSREIDALIHRDEKIIQRQVKLLLLGERSYPVVHHATGRRTMLTVANPLVLGAGESGKSTILKQMRLIYTRDGFSKNEKAEWRIIIFQNIIDALRMIVDAMEEFQIPFEYENTTVSLPALALPLPWCKCHPAPRSNMRRPTSLSSWRRKT
jgi:guanine nucleotide-binding protein subunit alpha, other